MREIEVKVLDIDINQIVSKLKKLGAKKVKDVIFNRDILDFEDNKLDQMNAWLRTRTDGKKNTLTFKHKKDEGFIEELEVEIGNYRETVAILNRLGMESKRNQENRRVMFDLDGVEVDIDLWPMIPPYMEVEAKTEEELYKTLEKLEIKKEEGVIITPKEVYKKYGIKLHEFPKMKLEQEKKDRVIG